MATTNDFCEIDVIMSELEIPSNVNSEDERLKTAIKKSNAIMNALLLPYAESLPYADSSITDELREAGNILAKRKWHIAKSHWDDAKALKEDFDILWNVIIKELKAIPTSRTQPIAVSGSIANSATLLKDIPGVTDSEGNVVTWS